MHNSSRVTKFQVSGIMCLSVYVNHRLFISQGLISISKKILKLILLTSTSWEIIW